MNTPAGILLPESVLSSSWFLVMATVVAFNTIIYIGLILSKLIPMPKQFHPHRVRRMLRKINVNPDKDTAADKIPRPEPDETDDPYENMRRDIARRGIPQAFGLAGGLIILMSATALMSFFGTGFGFELIEFGVGVLFLVIAMVLGRSHVRARTLMWIWAASSAVLVAMMAGQAILVDSQLPLAYSLMVMVAFAPITLAWRPSVVAAVLMLVCMSAATVLVEGDEDARLIPAALAGLFISAVLLHLRLTSIVELSDEKERYVALASTDILTGVLSRHGLLTLMPGQVGTAEQLNEAICVMSIDVEQLGEANRQYGSAYGDDVLRAVAAAIQEHAPPGCLVARWSGDMFLVAWIGGRPNGERIARDIREQILLNGVNLGKWPTPLRIGIAAGYPRTTTFDHLIEEATAYLAAP